MASNNLKLIHELKILSPHAKIVVTAQSNSRAQELYKAGADYVLRPNIATAHQLLPIVERLLRGEEAVLKETEMAKLSRREEIFK